MLKPVSIITQLEDSPPTIDGRLLNAYLRTVYQLSEPPGFSFVIGSLVQPKASGWFDHHGIMHWAFITAWNPRSTELLPADNEQRNAELVLALQSGGWNYFTGLGIGPDASWAPEQSFWVLNIRADAAVRLGRQFGQNALVWWEKEKPVELWWL